MSVSLSNSLERKFGIPVPVTQLISGPSINQLIASVFAEWEDSPSPERSEPAEVVGWTRPVGRRYADSLASVEVDTGFRNPAASFKSAGGTGAPLSP